MEEIQPGGHRSNTRTLIVLFGSPSLLQLLWDWTLCTPITLLPEVLEKVCQDGVCLLLVALFWPD